MIQESYYFHLQCFSFLVYWLVSLIYPPPNPYNSFIAIVKGISVSLLLNISNPFSYLNLIIVFYLLGDVVIIWAELYSMYFFMTGHLILLGYLIYLNPYTLLLLFLSLPILYIIAILIHLYLEKAEILYKYYILSLEILIVASFMNNYFGFLLLVISDFIIGFNIPFCQVLSWPLYYLNLFLLVEFYEKISTND